MFETSAPRDEPLLPTRSQPVSELLDKTGLSNPGLACEANEEGATVGRRCGRLFEVHQFAMATNKIVVTDSV